MTDTKTDGWTDRITVANMHYSSYASLAHENPTAPYKTNV